MGNSHAGVRREKLFDPLADDDAQFRIGKIDRRTAIGKMQHCELQPKKMKLFSIKMLNNSCVGLLKMYIDAI